MINAARKRVYLKADERPPSPTPEPSTSDVKSEDQEEALLWAMNEPTAEEEEALFAAAGDDMWGNDLSSDLLRPPTPAPESSSGISAADKGKGRATDMPPPAAPTTNGTANGSAQRPKRNNKDWWLPDGVAPVLEEQPKWTLLAETLDEIERFVYEDEDSGASCCRHVIFD